MKYIYKLRHQTCKKAFYREKTKVGNRQQDMHYLCGSVTKILVVPL